MEGLTACTKHDVTRNGHTDVTTMGLTMGLTHTYECYSALVTIVMSWEEQRVGPSWVDEWEEHVYMYIPWGNRRDEIKR